MQLENLAYESKPIQAQKQQVYFVVGDLEKLSSTALYGYGNGGDSGNSGGFSYISLPGMNVQAHCHEGANGTTHFKTFKGEKIRMLDSYQFAMGDLYAKALNLKTGYNTKK